MSVYRQAIANLGLDPHAPLTQEGIRAIDVEAQRIKDATAPNSPTFDPRKAAPVETSDHDLAFQLLREAGATEVEAYKSLAKGQSPGHSAIQAKRAELQAQADEQARIAFERSPEGKREAAERALAERIGRDRIAEGGRELLRAQGLFSEDRIAEMSTDELLVGSGIEKSAAQKRREEIDAKAIASAEEKGIPTSLEPIIVGRDLWGNE